MIEVEKTLPLPPELKAGLIQDAEFLGIKILNDAYYDLPGFALTTQDKWLRKRNGRFELKLPAGNMTKLFGEQYEELENDADIAKALGLSLPLEESLAAARIEPFCNIITTREKYKKDGFAIDIDAVNTGYAAVEIELMVGKAEEVEPASKRINEFARRHGLQEENINGKLIEYIRLNRPEHFAALNKAGIVFH